jgi:hypothetical protein
LVVEKSRAGNQYCVLAFPFSAFMLVACALQKQLQPWILLAERALCAAE